jgi:hypothetical protein
MNVHERVVNGGSDSSSGSHVAYPLRSSAFKDVFHKVSVTNVAAKDGNAGLAVFCEEQIQVGLLDSYVVVIIDLVDNHDIVSSVQQMLSNMRPDKACTSGYENLFVSDVRSYE